MCPACITTVALMVAGATSTGGLTALVVKRLRAKTGAKNVGATYSNYLDLTVLGRQDNQEGNPQAWIRHHDKYPVDHMEALQQ